MLAFYLCPPVRDVPGLNLKHAGPKLSRVRPKLDGGFRKLSLTETFIVGNMIDISGLKIKPVEERQAKASLYQKQHISKIDTVFPRPSTCPNVHGFNTRRVCHVDGMRA